MLTPILPIRDAVRLVRDARLSPVQLQAVDGLAAAAEAAHNDTTALAVIRQALGAIAVEAIALQV